MSEILAAAYALVAVGSSVAVYFKFIDRPLDRLLDRAFAGWHKNSAEVEEI